MFNAAIIGGGKYVLPIGSMFEASIVTNNLVKVKDGCLINQGRNINIPVNDYEECIIDNGLQGLKRNDLIVIRYSKDVETEIEKAETIVIKGVSGDTAVDPSYLTGDILAGATTDDFPLYRVKLDGLAIKAVEPMFNVMVSMNSLKESLAKTNASVDQLNTNLNNQLNSDKKYMKQRGQTNNANECILPGIYFTTLATNGAANYGVLLVITNQTVYNTTSGWFFQMWFITNGEIKIRRSINASDENGWTEWQTIVGANG